MSDGRSAAEGLPEGVALAALESIADGFYTLDRDWRFTLFNDRCERYFGVRREEVLGRRYLDAFPEVTGSDVYAVLARATATGEPQQYDGRSPATGVPILLRAFPTPNGLTVVFSDVTERFEANEALRRSEARYRALFDSLDEGFCVVEMLFDEGGEPVDYRFLETNAAFARQTGLADAKGRTMRSLAPDHEAHWFRIYGEVATTGRTVRFENPAGQLGDRWYDVTAFRVGAPEERQVGILFNDISERRRTEQALRLSEERFRIVARATRDAIWDWNLRDGTIRWNEGLRETLGHFDRETTADWWIEHIHPDDRARVERGIHHAIETGASKWEDEYRFRRAEDSYATVLDQGFLVSDESGKAIRMVGAMTDVTEERRATSALRTAERRQSFLLELGDRLRPLTEPAAVTSVAAEMLGRHLRVSRVGYGEIDAAQAVVSVERDWTDGAVASLAGESRPLDVFGPAIIAGLREGRTLRLDEVAADPLAAPYAEGYASIGTRSLLIVPLIKEGRFTAILYLHEPEPRHWTDAEAALAEEVAERTWAAATAARAQLALVKSEKRFEDIANSVDQMIWSTLPDGFHDYYNRRWYEYTGVPEGSTDGEEWNGMFHPDDQERAWVRWRRSLDTGEPYHIEYRLRHRSGQYRWVIGRALPVFAGDGSIERWYGTCTDIQDLKEAEAALREANETLETRVAERTLELQEAVRESEGFNYSVSHDLRAPLRAIVSTASILLDEAGPELETEHREMLVRQVENANRLGRLIDELLRLSRLSRAEVRRQPLDMTRKAREVAAAEREMRPGEATVDVQDGMTASGDPGLIRTLLHNLIGNALKFSPHGGVVRVRQEGDVFSISDEGVGFDMRYVHKIFRPFERLVLESEFPGTGIGLANVERIVRRHGGRVWAESEPGKGAAFFFTLEGESSTRPEA